MHTCLQEVLAVSDTVAAPRFDIYAGIHKGVRLLLGDVLARAGRVRADDPGALQDLAGQVERVADFCANHLAHENAFVHRALEQAGPVPAIASRPSTSSTSATSRRCTPTPARHWRCRWTARRRSAG